MSTTQLERQWAILKRVPSWGSAITVDKLAAYLMAREGITLDLVARESYVRKVQRDLKQLERVVEFLEVDRSEPAYRVSWKKNAPPLKISALSEDEVLAFGVLKKLDTDLLPRTLHEVLEPFFKTATLQAAEREGVNKRMAARWLSKIARLPEGPGFVAPKVDDAIVLAVHQSLLEESRLEIQYKDGSPRVVHPQAIVQQGVRTYMLAMPEGTDQVFTFMLHRIKSARKTVGRYVAAKDFDLAKYLSKGIATPVFSADTYGAPIRLKLWVHAASSWLGETGLSEDQTFTKTDEGFLLEATVNLSEELIRWILSMSHHVKVLGPKFVQERVRADFLKSAAQYA